MKNKDSRRQFLRNTSLAALSFGILPAVAKTTTEPKPNSPILCDESTEDAYGQDLFTQPMPLLSKMICWRTAMR